MIPIEHNVWKPRSAAGLLLLTFAVSICFGQDLKPSTSEQDDIVRVNTELVQTDVMVFDNRGRFVNGLRREDFELHIDGKPRAITFFDRVIAGSGKEEGQLAAAGSENRKDAAAPAPFDRGRTVFFFVDDLHLTPNDLNTTRNLLLHYVDRDLGQDDQAAVTSATGQVGFLQQLSDNKDVMRAAVSRLKARPSLILDSERPPMSEYQALAIERNNRDVISYFVDELMKDMPSLPPAAAARIGGGLPTSRAEQQVRDRAHLILQQSSLVTRSALSGLESLVRSASKLPGRKLVFFISDGFFLDLHNSDSLDRLRQITSAAAHSGVVIYSLDARGLTTGIADASSGAGPDPGGRLQRIAAAELIESQEGMNALAADTGGRGIFNTNSLDAGIVRALDDTSTYYVLAWRPDSSEQRSEKFRTISVSIIGHPELVVRTREGFFSIERQSSKIPKPDEQRSLADKDDGNQLRAAMLSGLPEDRLPVSLSLTYVNSPDRGLLLTVSMQVKSDALSFASSGARQKADVEIAGFVFDAEGKAGAHFSDELNVEKPGPAAGNGARNVVYTYPVKVPPGLYQVRIGMRDRTSNHVGTASDWIKIPDAANTPLALSSLILSERRPNAATVAPDITTIEQSGFSVDHRFQKNSSIRFLSFIYSARPAAKPDIGVQLRILRANRPVLTTSSRRVATEGISDLTRMAYAAEISLEGLPAGKYVLELTAVDRVTEHQATQQTRFQIQ